MMSLSHFLELTIRSTVRIVSLERLDASWLTAKDWECLESDLESYQRDCCLYYSCCWTKASVWN